MNTSPDFDRDAIARAVFDTAICHPNREPIHVFEEWLSIIAGLGGYLAWSADSHTYRDTPPPGTDLAAIGAAIEKAALIARELAEHIEIANNREWLKAFEQKGAPSSRNEER